MKKARRGVGAGAARPEPHKHRLPDAIVVGDDANPVAVVSRAADSPRVPVEPIALPPAVRRSLEPLLAQAPRVFAAGADLVNGITKLVVTFSPDVARGLATGAYELMPATGGAGVRTIARAASSKMIVGHGALTNAVNPVAVATAVWQVAAIVTAQKFLADINTRLANVERGIDAIQAFLEDDVRARLRTGAMRLRDMAEEVRDQRMSPRELDTLAREIESIDREAQNITEQYALQLGRVPVEVAGQEWGATWSTNDAKAEANGALKKAEAQSGVYLASLEIRVLANTIRGAFGLESNLAARRIDKVDQDLERHATLVWALQSAFVAKLPTLKASLRRDLTDSTHRAVVQGKLNDTVRARQLEENTLRGATAHVRELLRQSATDLASTHEIEVDVAPDGTIVSAARRLLAPRF